MFKSDPPLASKTKETLPPTLRNPITLQGWLHKRGGSHGGHRSWKKRHFRLTADRRFGYFGTDDMHGTSLGMVALPLDGFVTKSPAMGWTSHKGPNVFSLNAPGRAPFFMQAATEAEADAWIAALTAAVAAAVAEEDRHTQVRFTREERGTSTSSPTRPDAAHKAAMPEVEVQRNRSLVRTGSMGGIRNLVSKKKKRYVRDGARTR